MTMWHALAELPLHRGCGKVRTHNRVETAAGTRCSEAWTTVFETLLHLPECDDCRIVRIR
jgi:hypothetical protein